MTTEQIESLQANLDEMREGLERNQWFISDNRKLLLQLSPSALLRTASPNFLWFTVTSREDLMLVMSLVQETPWRKDTGTKGIEYHNYAGKIYIFINAEGAALPGTCRLVEREVTIPATPERIELRTVVECVKETS